MCGINWTTALEYLKVALSWPPLLTIFLFWFVRRFSQKIAELIDKIRLAEFGGSKFTFEGAAKQQEAALPPALLPQTEPAPVVPPNTDHTQGTGKATANISMPMPTVHANGGPTINFKYSQRAKHLYPSTDPEPFVQWMHLNPGPAFDDYIDKVLQLNYERTFNMIFGTQVQVLESLNDPTLHGPSPSAMFVPHYERHLSLTGRSDRNFNDYLAFLVARNLVQNVGTPEGPLYQIAPAGKEFLGHIKQYYPLQWNSKAY